VSWQTVLSGVDAAESWMAGQSYWIQVFILLAVLLPLGWATAGGIDRVVDKLLWPRTRRELRSAAVAASASHSGEDVSEGSHSAVESGGVR
jgi:hypothetical protein